MGVSGFVTLLIYLRLVTQKLAMEMLCKINGNSDFIRNITKLYMYFTETYSFSKEIQTFMHIPMK